LHMIGRAGTSRCPRSSEQLPPLPDHLYPVDRLPGEAGAPGDLTNSHRLTQHRLRSLELPGGDRVRVSPGSTGRRASFSQPFSNSAFDGVGRAKIHSSARVMGRGGLHGQAKQACQPQNMSRTSRPNSRRMNPALAAVQPEFWPQRLFAFELAGWRYAARP
jgi:hypothetical protein